MSRLHDLPLARIRARLSPPPAVDIAPLAAFRIAFGGLMAVEMGRFFQHGWVRGLFVDPVYHFTYPGLDWVRPWPGDGMLWHFGVLLAAAVLVAIGVYYRAAIVVFALGFTYVFVLDAAFYQNHFYLICLLAWLMALVPADRAWSLDAALDPRRRSATAPGWTLWILRAQIAIVYTFAGLAKLNPDWLRGEPVRTFLAQAPEVAVLGPLLAHPAAPWVISYGGLVLDLAVIPLLAWPRTRLVALAAVLAFHLTNAALFPIGIFPWLMIAALPLLLPPAWTRAAGEIALATFAPRRGRRARDSVAAGPIEPDPPLAQLPHAVPNPVPAGPVPPAAPGPRPMPVLPATPAAPTSPGWPTGPLRAALAAYVAAQIALPLRHLAYPGNPSWTGEGERFAWRMMLDLKTGSTTFTAADPATGARWEIDPATQLADWQARKLEIRPDLILQLAHHLRDGLSPDRPGIRIYTHAAMSLNGRPARPLVDPAVDLASEPRTFRPARWILPPDP